MRSGTLNVRALVSGLNQRGRDIPVGGEFEVSTEAADTLIARGHVEVVPVKAARPTRRQTPASQPTLSSPSIEAPSREPTLSDPD